MTFRVEDGEGCRQGVLSTPHGPVDTPVFMPVGTQGAVKGIPPAALREVGSTMLLANAYHLHQRPGEAAVESVGGLHSFMGWDGPILTDSGGYQVFSLAHRRQITDDGVTFQSTYDGSTILLTPERVLDIQARLGVDVAMVLDECPADPTDRAACEAAVERTIRWAERSAAWRAEHPGPGLVFAITQGGVFADLRARCSESLVALDFDGYACGGVSVGENKDDLRTALELTAPMLPEDRPRYLMGVGYVDDLTAAIHAGFDMFDCVAPTREARTARAWTANGRLNLKNAVHSGDPSPIEEGCDCPACSGGFTRGALHHYFRVGEILGGVMVSLHNLRHVHRAVAALAGREI